jgi:hypothetical protein
LGKHEPAPVLRFLVPQECKKGLLFYRLRKCSEIETQPLFNQNFMKRLITLLPCLLLAAGVSAAPFGPDLVVVQVGDGAAALTSAATAGFLNEFTFTGSLLQTIALPTSASGANKMLTFSGTATSEGFLTRSANGSVLTVAGYNAAPGVTVAGSAIATVNRVVGVVSANGTVDTSTAIGSWVANPGNPRSVVSDDGTHFWISGSAGGVAYVSALGGSSALQLAATPLNARVAGIYGGQLYTGSGSSPFIGVSSIGIGLPTTAGQTSTLLIADPGTSPSPYGYLLADLNAGVAGLDTAWVADDRTQANGGGIQKYTFDGSTWTLSYILGTNGITTGLRGLAVDLSGANPILYGTTTEGNANKLVTVTDTGAASTVTVLATAPANTAYRGVALVPEPASFAMLGFFGLVTLLFARRRK